MSEYEDFSLGQLLNSPLGNRSFDSLPDFLSSVCEYRNLEEDCLPPGSPRSFSPPEPGLQLITVSVGDLHDSSEAGEEESLEKEKALEEEEIETLEDSHGGTPDVSPRKFGSDENVDPYTESTGQQWSLIQGEEAQDHNSPLELISVDPTFYNGTIQIQSGFYSSAGKRPLNKEGRAGPRDCRTEKGSQLAKCYSELNRSVR